MAWLGNDFFYLLLCLKRQNGHKRYKYDEHQESGPPLKVYSCWDLVDIGLVQTLNREGGNSEIWWLVQTILWIFRSFEGLCVRSYTVFGLSYCQVSAFAFYFCHGKTRLRVQSYNVRAFCKECWQLACLGNSENAVMTSQRKKVLSLPGVLVCSEMRKILWCLQEFCAYPSWWCFHVENECNLILWKFGRNPCN